MVVVKYRTLDYMVIICFLKYIFDKNTAKVPISVFYPLVVFVQYGLART